MIGLIRGARCDLLLVCVRTQHVGLFAEPNDCSKPSRHRSVLLSNNDDTARVRFSSRRHVTVVESVLLLGATRPDRDSDRAIRARSVVRRLGPDHRASESQLISTHW